MSSRTMTAETQKQVEQPRSASERTRSGRFYRPNVDILEKRDELLVRADVPGAAGDEIEVHFEGGELSIRAPAAPRQEDATNFLLSEYGVGDFYRNFSVSEAIDPAKISAEYKDGVLTLHLPKAEAAKPRKIKVKTS
ncbi:MAG TPA: Hsp20/alpha crystallin family protein [Pirellulales bacterium]|nr:Hsp20/alpha crystallin family protein [Pirellulales bacterium]